MCCELEDGRSWGKLAVVAGVACVAVVAVVLVVTCAGRERCTVVGREKKDRGGDEIWSENRFDGGWVVG